MGDDQLRGAIRAFVEAAAREVESLPKRSVVIRIPHPGEPVFHTHEVINVRLGM